MKVIRSAERGWVPAQWSVEQANINDLPVLKQGNEENPRSLGPGIWFQLSTGGIAHPIYH